MEKLLELGQQAGTPIAYIVIIVFAYKLFDIFATYLKNAGDRDAKFCERFFTHVDNMEEKLEELSRTGVENTKQFTQALSALNQIITANTNQVSIVTQEVKDLANTTNALSKAVETCKFLNRRDGDIK